MTAAAVKGASAIALPAQCDVLVVGGGINGAGIARDLAGRGCSVVLVEKDDLAQHTSSSSTKLIHGGLRYLEYYEFGLVRKALQEREVLLKSAPHIMRPLRFVMPHDPSMRPAWFIGLGVFLYDHLAHRDVLPASRSINLRAHPAGAPLKANYTKGFEYSDGWVDDARLVVLNALDARAKGAIVLTRCECVAAARGEKQWTVTLQAADAARANVSARALVNAAGPWAESFLRGAARSAHGESLATRSLRLVKGSHIVVPRLFEHEYAYIFQNPDKRIIFAIPYEVDFTLIGTTDVEIEGVPDSAHIDDDEVAYLCAQASRYFARAVTAADVVWSYCGVRPLLDDQSGDASAVTRDYQLESNSGAAPLLSVWGGKITTFRKLAEEAGDSIVAMLGDTRRAWSRGAYLPGGDLAGWIGRPVRPDRDFAQFVAELNKRYAWLAPSVAHRLARAYGSRINLVLGAARSPADLGREIAPGLFEAELDYLRREEWAVAPEDVLWRRSKLGLHYSREQRAAVASFFSDRHRTALHAAS
jgi:glycerol-3-phosphate dehydrogenase